MLINSNTLKGKCPVCGTESCVCGGPSQIVEPAGPLKRYPLGRGASVKLSESEAIARGLMKKRDPVLNKKRHSATNKARG